MDRQDDRTKEMVIREMFSGIAPAYDRVNYIMSWGQDARWRRLAVGLAYPDGGWVLDAATGTGDIAVELARHNNLVVGLDLCPEMLSRSQNKTVKKRLGQRINFVLGDALALPFSDNSFDCALNGFALRNVADINRFLAELRRVVKPGGRVICMELVRPWSGIIGTLYRTYLFRVVPVIGRWLSGDNRAYRYLPDSVGSFITTDELQAIMENVGFCQVSHKCLNLGTVSIHVGVK